MKPFITNSRTAPVLARRAKRWLVAALMLVAMLASSCQPAPTPIPPSEPYVVPLPPTPTVAAAPTTDAPVPHAVPGPPTGGPSPTSALAQGPVSLVILHTNDTRGYVDPCGWGVPKGGVARRATAIEAIVQEGKRLLLLDAGNTLTGQDLADNSRGQVIVEAMNMLGYHAMTIGERELYLELDELAARMADAEFAFLSANLVYQSSGEPFAQPFVVIDLDGLRVGVLGLTNVDVTQILQGGRALGAVSESVKAALEVLDPIETTRRYLPELAEMSDLVVVLSHLGVGPDQQLAREVPGIDVIVGGYSRNLLSPPLAAHGALIAQAGYDGEYLGTLRLEVNSEEITRYEGQVNALDPTYADDPRLAAWLEEVKRR